MRYPIFTDCKNRESVKVEYGIYVEAAKVLSTAHACWFSKAGSSTLALSINFTG
jgi:hypothetical protein